MSISDTYRRIADLQDLDDVMRAAAEQKRRDALDMSTAYAPPDGADQVGLIDIWKDVLAIDAVGIDDNFFELGGDSLQLTQVLSRIIHVFGRELGVEVFLEGPTIRQLAEALATAPERGHRAGIARLLDAEPHDAD